MCEEGEEKTEKTVYNKFFWEFYEISNFQILSCLLSKSNKKCTEINTIPCYRWILKKIAGTSRIFFSQQHSSIFSLFRFILHASVHLLKKTTGGMLWEPLDKDLLV